MLLLYYYIFLLTQNYIPKKKRIQIIEKHQKKREFLKPTEKIYLTALHIYFNVSSRIEHILIAIKDHVKELPYYQDKEKDFFSKERVPEIVEQGKKELSEYNCTMLLEYLEYMQTEYKEFLKISTLPTIDIDAVTEEDINTLLMWHIDGNPEYRWETEEEEGE